MTYKAKRDLIQRWFAKVDPQPDGCWLWTGGTTQGYGRIYVAQGEPMMYAHRLAYELFIGPIPADLDIDHQCHNEDPSCPGGKCRHRLCVHPRHIVSATRQDNLLNSSHTLTRHHRDGTYCGSVTCKNCKRFQVAS